MKKQRSNRVFSRVLYKKEGNVAYITLNRPEVLNALDSLTHKELALIWDDFERDNNIRIGVLTGAGDKAFSVGQDLKELASGLNDDAPRLTFGSKGTAGWPRLTERFAISKPLIAKVNGYALGGGFELALACDILIASENSIFALPEASLGLIPGAGGIFRLTRQIPFKIALGYLMTGRRMNAARAYELGLINEIVSAKKIDKCVDKWIKDILNCAPLSTKVIKESALKSVNLSLEEAFVADYIWEKRRLGSVDSREGIKAFLEKRQPKWLGK